ncbi:MAG: efflux RND transporter periplasmic adaptor subunit [Rikenellaceae bacterium]
MKRILRTFSALAFTALFIGCGASQETKKEEVTEATEQAAAIEVSTGEAVLTDVEQKAVFTGTVEAKVVNKISPQNPVRINKVFVEVGDRVSKGAKLAEMDNVNLEQARVRRDNAQAEFNRTDELYKIGGESKSMWDARKLDLDVAKSSYDNLYENTFLISPISGIVTSRNYDEGDMFLSGTPLFVVEQISPVKLTINVSESYFSKVKKGMSIDVVADAYEDEHFTGVITLVYPTIDASTRTFPIEIEIANTNQRLRPGMFTRATISFGTESRVVVPDLAVVKQSGSGDRYVYSVENGIVVFNKVELGQRLDDKYEILSGVNPGATVITSGQSRVKKGDKVTY